MIKKIKKLAQSPVFESKTDIENFIRIMGLSSIELNILQDSKKIIKKYYLTRETNSEEKYIIDKALALIYDQKDEDLKSYNRYEKEISKEDIIINTNINKNEIEKQEPEIMKALKSPYQSLESFIRDSLLYISPVYNIAVYFSNNHLNDEDDSEKFRHKIEILSDKHKLENELISTGEKQVLDFFTTTIQSTRRDMEKIIGQNIGNIFFYNDDTLISLKQEMNKYKNYIMSPKMNEMYGYAEKLKNFWIQNEEGTGKGIKEFIKGGSLGIAGAALLGPLGIIAAAGAMYLSGNEDEKKKEAMLDNIFDNWAKTHDLFYYTQLKEYYKVYNNFFSKIAKQYVINYQSAYKLSKSHQKQQEYEKYLKQKIIDTISNEEFKKMQQELAYLSEFINSEGV